MRGVLKPRKTRIERDAYFTPAPLALAICRRLAQLVAPPKHVLEPGAGEGAFMEAARATWPAAVVAGIDLEPQSASITRGDFLQILGGEFALVLGNPPYLLAEDFVHAGLRHVEHLGHVAFLLRLSFLGGQGRARSLWAKRDMRWLVPIAPRPSFTADGKTDAAEYALFVWQRGFAGSAAILRPLLWARDGTQLALTDPEAA